MSNNLHNQFWKYFLLFTGLIIIVLLILQVLFVNDYYAIMKTRDVNTASHDIKKCKNNKDFYNCVDDLAYKGNVCIEIIDKNKKQLFKSELAAEGCLADKDIVKFKNKFINSNKQSFSYNSINPKFNNKNFLQCTKLDNNKYLFVNTSLEAVDSTYRILHSQFILLSVLLLLLSFILSYFVSKSLSKPIVKINNDAKELAKGNFNQEIISTSSIKELKELAETLNYTRMELAESEELKRDLLANVSHDMKTPLTMIKAYTEMMLDLHKNSSKKREDDGRIIIDEVNRLALLVDDILELSKIQSNIDTLNKEEIDVIKLIDNVINKFKVLTYEDDYNFIFTHNIDELIIEVDKKKLEQVIYNLINNAINYVGNDKEVIVDVNGDDYIVSISDHGKGIKDEDLPYIWDKYYKNSKKHKRNKLGTGLGLSIVKTALEKHGYDYGVETKLGQGSTFWFKLKK